MRAIADRLRINGVPALVPTLLVATCLTLIAVAPAGAWSLQSTFGRHGVAGLPVREEGIDSLYPPGPGAHATLLAPGPGGSLFVAGYARSKRGSLLVARLSTRGTLVKAFGRGGLVVVPAIYSTPQRPARILALSGGRVLVVGLDRSNRITLVRLSASGRADGGFAHQGVARFSVPGAHGHAIVAAATVAPSGEILIAAFAAEVAQPANEPRITPGLGVGAPVLVHVLASGALDGSFGSGGFRTATAPSPASGEAFAAGATLAADGSLLLAYEQASAPGGQAALPAVQKLEASGGAAVGFGSGGVALLPFVPALHGESSSLFGGLFALPGGGVEASFGGAGELFRFTPAGALDPAFGARGLAVARTASAAALALASDGETFALSSAPALTLSATLADGAPDPALGAGKGMRFAVTLPRRRAGEEQQATELLASGGTLDVLVGEEVVRLRR